MSLPPKLREKNLARLDELIQNGLEIRARVGNSRELVEDITKRVCHETGDLTTEEAFRKWQRSALTILSQIVGASAIHSNMLLQFQKINAFPNHLDWGLGQLRAVRDDLDGGFLEDIASSIEAEIASDYMGQAEHLLAEGQPGKYDHVPAAVLTGAVLEKGLRTLCDGQTPPIHTTTDNGKPKKMNVMIDDLKKASVYNEMKAKQLRAWAGVRNHAAHGEFDEFTRGDVEEMITGVNRFLGDYLG